MDTKIKAVFTQVASEKLGRPLFRRIGTAFVNRDATLNVILDALPVSGRLHIRDLDLRAGLAPDGAPADAPSVAPVGSAHVEVL